MPVLTELKERNVWSALVVYLGGGWVVIEALNFITQKYLWPEIIIDLVILIVIFGLPAILIQTWYHGKPGKQKIQKKELILHSINAIFLIFLVARILITEDYSTSTEINSERSIAVLPFKNLSKNEENQYFADGVIEAVRNNLGQINELWVTAGNSTEKYRNSSKSGSEIATELGVAFMLSGSIQRYENHIRIIVELSDTKKNKQIWTEVFDRQYEDLFELQSEVALEIANKLNMKLTPQETTLISKKYTDDIDAYVLYLEGQGIIRKEGRSSKDLEKAERLFKQAIKLDANFSLAYVGLANTYLFHIMWGRTYPKEIIPIALETIMKAMEIDNSMGESYQILGLIKFYQLDFKSAEKYFLKAIELNPNYLESYAWLANIYVVRGKMAKSLELYDKANNLDPSAVNYRFLRVNVSYFARDYDAGLTEIESNSGIVNDSEIQWVQANLYSAKGDYQKSINIHQSRSGGDSKNWALGYVYGLTGKSDSAKYILNYLLEKRNHQYVPSYMISCVYVGLGEYDKAIDWLQEAYDEGPDLTFIFGILHDPRLDSIVNEPKYLELRKKFEAKIF